MSEAWLQVANHWAAHLAPLLWRTSWQGGLFIALAWVVCRLFWRIPPGVRYWIWWIASLQLLIRLAVPSPIEVPVLPAAPSPVPEPEVASQSTYVAPLVLRERATVAAPVGIPVRPSAELFAMAAWLLGFGFFSTASLVRFSRARTLTRSATPIRDEVVLGLFKDLCKQAGVKPCRLLASPMAPCPLLTGWIRPAVLLPAARDRRLGEPELRMALAHELAHLRRHDLWFSLAPTVAQALLFFHPLSWLASHEASAACEEACDVEAMQLGGGSAASYARLLLDSARSAAPVAALGAAFSFRLLQRRITMLNLSTAQSGSTYRRASMALVALAALFAVPWTVTAQVATAASTPHALASFKPGHHRHTRTSHKIKANHSSKKHAQTASGAIAPLPRAGVTIGLASAAPVAAFSAETIAAPRAIPAGGHVAAATATLMPPIPVGASRSHRVAPPAPRAMGFGGAVAPPSVAVGMALPTSAGRLGGGLTRVDTPPDPTSGGGLEVASPSEVTHENGSLTARFRHADIVEALTQVFDALGVNYVISPDVAKGTVTCSFKGLPLGEVLSSMLKGAHQQLTWRFEGNVYYVVPKE